MAATFKNPFQYLYYHIKNPWDVDKLKSQGDQRLFDALDRIVEDIDDVAKSVVAGEKGGSALPWFQEVPKGDMDGVNTVYFLSHLPIIGSLAVYLNIIQVPGRDFSESPSALGSDIGKVIFTVAPKARDIGYFYARYQWNPSNPTNPNNPDGELNG